MGKTLTAKLSPILVISWARFDQTTLSPVELQDIFESYFHIFPWHCLPHDAVGFDMGCGSGRWANHVAPKVHRLYCFDAAQAAVRVAKKALRHHRNCDVALASIDHIPLPDESMDFGYSLGVLHYIPDPVAGLRSCVAKLKPGATVFDLCLIIDLTISRPGSIPSGVWPTSCVS